LRPQWPLPDPCRARHHGAIGRADDWHFAVYTPLQSRGLVLAVLASSVVGLIADSVLFLWLAFGSLDYLAGQILGKLWMVLLALPFIHWIRKRELST